MLVHIWRRPKSLALFGTTIKLRELVRILTVDSTMSIEYDNSNDSWSLLDVGRPVSAAQHQNAMNVGLLVNDGDRFGAAVNAVSPALPEPGRAHEPAGISLFTPQDTLLLQVLDLEYALRLKAQSVAAKSQGQYKAETFLLSPGEFARFSSDSVKLQVLQHRMHQLDLAERDLDCVA